MKTTDGSFLDSCYWEEAIFKINPVKYTVHCTGDRIFLSEGKCSCIPEAQPNAFSPFQLTTFSGELFQE